jgi:hypothetical protein
LVNEQIVIDLFCIGLYVRQVDSEGYPDEETLVKIDLSSTATTVDDVRTTISDGMNGYDVRHIWYEFEGRWELLRYNSQIARLESSSIVVDNLESEQAPMKRTWGSFKVGDMVDV